MVGLEPALEGQPSPSGLVAAKLTKSQPLVQLQALLGQADGVVERAARHQRVLLRGEGAGVIALSNRLVGEVCEQVG